MEAVNCLLQDVCSSPTPFGGITVIFGGDFQQTLPVIPHDTRQDIIFATIQSSVIWNDVQILHLRQNMQVAATEDAPQLAEWLVDVGHGRSRE